MHPSIGWHHGRSFEFFNDQRPLRRLNRNLSSPNHRRRNDSERFTEIYVALEIQGLCRGNNEFVWRLVHRVGGVNLERDDLYLIRLIETMTKPAFVLGIEAWSQL